MSDHLAEALLDSLDDLALERLAERMRPHLRAEPEEDGFFDVKSAASFLDCPSSRIYALVSARRIPHHRDGSRLLFDRGELRTWVRNGGAKRP